MKKDIELILKQALEKLRSASRFPIKEKCLKEEDFACLIEGQLSDSERKKLFKHILSCQACALTLRDHLLVLNAIDRKGLLETPEAIVQAAMDLYSLEVGSDILEVILNFTEKMIELVRTTGEILRGPQLVPVPVLRSQGEENAFPNEIKIVKEFSNFLTEVDVEKKKPDLCDVEIRLTEKETKQKLKGFRVTLNKNGREIESCLMEEGKVTFKEVRPDKYTISIIKDDQKLGIIELQITTSNK